MLSCAWPVFGSVILNLWCVLCTYTTLRVILVKHSSVLPDDGSHKIRNMSESFLIFCLLNFYITYFLTSKFCIIECISRTIKVIDYTYNGTI
jgi:hypothetical protein